MNLRASFVGVAAILAAMPFASAAPSEATIPPGPVVPAQSTNAPPMTSAPLQPNAKSAPGAASPNGANGLNTAGNTITKSPNTPPETPPLNPAAAAPAPTTPAAAASTSKPTAPASVLDNYLSALNDALKLSPEEKTDIQTYYLTDGPTLEKILNDASLSPLQQDQEVSQLRDQRNAKIDALLADVARRHEFAQVEATYRVALLESAADGGLNPSQPPAPVPAPSDITPGQAEPTPDAKHPVQ